MADHEYTLGELARNQGSSERRLDNAIRDMVGVREYKADQARTALSIDNLARDLGFLRSDFAAHSTKHEADIDAVRKEHAADVKELHQADKAVEDKQEAYEKDQRSTRSKWILTWVGLVVGPIIVSIVGALFDQGATT